MVFYPSTRETNSNAQVVVGQRVYCGLYGGNYGIVTAIHGEQRPATIHAMLGGAMVAGGNAYFDVAFEGHKSKMLPEAIMRGVQWKIFDSVATAEEIEEAKLICAAAIAAKEAQAKADAERRAEDRAKHLNDNPHLKPIKDSGMSPGKCAAHNIRIELKKAFPGVKFSVRSDYDSVNIGWEYGPTRREVEAITCKYKAGHFDGMTDSYSYNSEATFASVFGDPKYVFVNRGYGSSDRSEAAQATICKAYSEKYNMQFNSLRDRMDGHDYWSDFAHKVLSNTSFPAGDVTVSGIEDVPEDQRVGYGFASYYRATYSVSTKKSRKACA